MVGLARLAILVACAFAAWAEVRAGAARTVITPDLKAHAPVYLAGFGQNRLATAIHDDLFVRCLALSTERQRALVLCGVDSIGLFFDDVARIRAAVERAVAPVKADVLVASTHDHQAPDTMGLWGPAMGQSGINEAYNTLVIERAAEAAALAVRALRPARITLARTHTLELDSFIHDNRPPMVHDSELIVLSARDRRGRPIGTVVNWANHPETLGSKNTEVTADYPAALYARLEERLGGIAVFLNGAIGGMQSPLGAKVGDAPDNSFEKARIIGRRVAEIAADAVLKARPESFDRIVHRETMVPIQISNPGFRLAAQADVFRGRKKPMADGSGPTPVGAVKLLRRGKPWVEIALVPGELYPELSVGGVERYPGADLPDAPLETPVKKMMTAPYRMLVGLANDEIGYIIPKVEWDEKPPWLQNATRRWYGEVNSVGPEAAPLLATALQQVLR